MATFIGTDGGDAFADDMRLDDDLYLMIELADQAAQGALINYSIDDWRRSPLSRALDVAVKKMLVAGFAPPPAVIEAQERFEAARIGVT